VCRYEDTCCFMHGDKPGHVRPAEQCFEFEQSGVCRYEDNCRFAHGDQQPQQRRIVLKRYNNKYLFKSKSAFTSA
jgi:hypothetical protein